MGKGKRPRGRVKPRRGRTGGATRRAAPVVTAFDLFEGVDEDDRAEILALVDKIGCSRGSSFARLDAQLWIAAQAGAARRVEAKSGAHRLRCAEVMGRDEPVSDEDRASAFLVGEGAPACERMTMSVLVRRAL